MKNQNIEKTLLFYVCIKANYHFLARLCSFSVKMVQNNTEIYKQKAIIRINLCPLYTEIISG